MKLGLVLSALVFCAACSSDDDASKDQGMVDGHASEASVSHRYYEYVLPDCTSDGMFNCKPHLELCEGGDAIITVTDVLNGGSYTETAEGVSTSWIAADVPESIVFTWTDDGQALTDNWNQWTWRFVANPKYRGCQ